MKIKKRHVLEFLLLELLCYVPIAIIAGNILPSIGGFKVHWLYIGLVFICTFLVLSKRKSMNGAFLLIIVFLVIQVFTSIRLSLPAFIDFVSGPLLLIAVVNITTSDIFELSVLRRYRTRIMAGLSIPIIVALLQYLKILPLELLNATYVNQTIYGTEILDRVNGFLYHGVELSIIIFFFFANVALSTSYLKTYLVLGAMMLFQFITLIKAGILTSFVYTAYYAYIIDRRLRSFKSLAMAIIIFLGFSYVYVLVPDLEAERFTFDIQTLRFEDQLFTGRGFIWNVYIDGIQRSFSFLHILFGGGFGSAPDVFKAGLYGQELPNGWSAGPHNLLLELFVSGGLFAIWLIAFILRAQYLKLSRYFVNDSKLFKSYFFGMLLVPIVIMGITSPIMSMFIYWCGLSATVISLKVKFS